MLTVSNFINGIIGVISELSNFILCCKFDWLLGCSNARDARHCLLMNHEFFVSPLRLPKVESSLFVNRGLMAVFLIVLMEV